MTGKGVNKGRERKGREEREIKVRGQESEKY